MKRLSNGHLLHPISEVILSHVEVPLKGPELLAVSHGSEEIVSSAILEHIVCDCHSAIYFYPQESLYQTCVDSNFLFLTNNLLQNHLNPLRPIGTKITCHVNTDNVHFCAHKSIGL